MICALCKPIVDAAFLAEGPPYAIHAPSLCACRDELRGAAAVPSERDPLSARGTQTPPTEPHH